MHKIVMGLEIQPEFGFHSEKHPQPRGGIGSDRALAIDALPRRIRLCRDVNVLDPTRRLWN